MQRFTPLTRSVAPGTFEMGLVPSPTILTIDEMGRVASPIAMSVGQDGINAPGDVFIIQSLLNERLPKPHTPVPVNGVVDPGLILAIMAFQAVVMGMYPPTGQVAPGSPTYYALAARPMVDPSSPEARPGGAAPQSQAAPTVPRTPPRYGRVGIVPPEVIEAAVASQQRWKIPASVTIAQWIVESAWGAAMPPDSNNPFGIKAGSTQPAVEALTREVINGQTITITARFRKFDSLTEAFDQHGRLLATRPPYVNAMKLVGDPDAFADALTGVYATDPNYGTKLKWCMNAYGLKKHNQTLTTR